MRAAGIGKRTGSEANATGTFRGLREGGHPYVDRTRHLRWLAERGLCYFLARPPGFGKSLLLDTCRELFRGRRELFEGLAVHDEWDWTARHPVLRISLEPTAPMGPDALRERLAGQLGGAARSSGIGLRTRTLEDSLVSLADEMHERAGRRVAILIDGYDQPILDAIARPELARGNREILASFYEAIKECDAHMQLCIVAGVSGFTLTKTLGGGLNSLIDVSFDPRIADICGFTADEVRELLGRERDALDIDRIVRRYGGFNWGSETTVCNPVDILGVVRLGTLAPHWRDWMRKTALGRFVERLGDGDDWGGRLYSQRSLMALDVDDIDVAALRFQTGYEKVREVRRVGWRRVYGVG